MSEWSETWTYVDDAWHEGNPPIVGAREHAFWLGSSVFDGARAFEGVMPDLDQHCARVNRSAKAMGLKALKSDQEIEVLCREGVAKFAPDAALYIRPMYWALEGDRTAIVPKSGETGFAISLEAIPMAAPNSRST